MRPQTIAFEAIGTHWQIDTSEEISDVFWSEIVREVHERIAVFDKNYSRFREDSLVAEMSRKAGTYLLPEDAEPMLRLYQKLYRLTGGAVTPLIGQVLVDAGYDAKYSLKPKPLQAPPSWEETMDVRFPNLEIKKPALLDFGAAGKGYLIDIVGEILATHGLKSFCVDAGGDILQRNGLERSLRVGLEHPQHLEQVIGVFDICNQSICGSAGNRRAWGNFHHTIDPRTRTSPQHLLAVWTIAKTTMLADAMTTALMFVSPEKLLKVFDFEYLLLFPDLSIQKSSGFRAELFTA